MKLTRPNLGGWLTMLNCASWLVAWWVIQALKSVEAPYRFPSGVVISMGVLLGFLSLPIAWICILPPIDYHRNYEEVITKCIVLGGNSFVWRYGIAAVWNFIHPMIKRQLQPPPISANRYQPPDVKS